MARQASNAVATPNRPADELVLVFCEAPDGERCRVLDIRVRYGELLILTEIASGTANWRPCEIGELIYIPERRRTRQPEHPVITNTRKRSVRDVCRFSYDLHLELTTGGTHPVLSVKHLGGFVRVIALSADEHQVITYVMQPGDALVVGGDPAGEKPKPTAREQKPASAADGVLVPVPQRVHVDLGAQIRARISDNLSRTPAAAPQFHSKPFERGYEIWKLDSHQEIPEPGFREMLRFPGWPKTILSVLLIVPILWSCWSTYVAYRTLNPTVVMVGDMLPEDLLRQETQYHAMHPEAEGRLGGGGSAASHHVGVANGDPAVMQQAMPAGELALLSEDSMTSTPITP